jgi:redox-sensitive bicupin YhaK (pirin superfamily)
MFQIRKSAERGHFDHGWLDTYHTFSFGDYYDPDHTSFRALRVMNEDRVQPGEGFGMHGHRDMEIVTYVLEGALEHRDSLGNGSVLRPGDFQRMSAGTGIRHSEFNPSKTEPVHLYQIWLLPERSGIEPSYEERRFPEAEQHNRFRLVASRGGRDGSLTIHQDADVSLATLDPRTELDHALRDGRYAWLQVLRGQVSVAGRDLSAGDGVAVSGEPEFHLRATAPAEVMLFDLE